MSSPSPPPSTSPVTEALPRMLMVSAPPAPSTLFTVAESCTTMVSLGAQPSASLPVLVPPVVLEPSMQVLRRYQSFTSIAARLVNHEGIPPFRPWYSLYSNFCAPGAWAYTAPFLRVKSVAEELPSTCTTLMPAPVTAPVPPALSTSISVLPAVFPETTSLSVAAESSARTVSRLSLPAAPV